MSVTPETIATALGVAVPASSSPTEKQWSMWVADALMLIEARATQLTIEMNTIDEARLDYVIRESVVAHIKKPDDATQVTVSVDDGSSSKSYRSGHGRVVIRDEWWPFLGLTDPDSAFAIDMAPSSTVHLAWCSLSLGAAYCSCGVDIAGFPLFEGA